LIQQSKNKKEEKDKFPEYFDNIEEKSSELTNEEKNIYGTREPKDYNKIKLIGKGGCGLVWLGKKNNQNKEIAIKQISKKNSKEIYFFVKKEIEILKYINSDNDYIIKLLDCIEDSNDFWLIFEKGGNTLSNLTFKIKGEFHNNERVYFIQKGNFLKRIFEDLSLFKTLVKKLLEFLSYLNSKSIMHCDIKPDNILIDFHIDKEEKLVINSVKLIDFGSAIFQSNPESFNSNTPEYMSPEINELNEKGGNRAQITELLKNMNCWCIDIWSLGVMLLELVLSCPLWLSYKSKIKRNDKVIYTYGLFGVKGRSNNKIYQKQEEVSKNLASYMQDCLINEKKEKELFIDLLEKMTNINYKQRISPNDALKHEFFNK